MKRTVLLAVLAVCGCADKPAPKTQPTLTQEPVKKDDHDHGAGPHGGAIAHFGKYHAEFTVDHGKKEARVYILDGDAKKRLAVKAKELTVTVRGVKTKDSCQVVLKPEPEKGEAEGTASCFVGTHDGLGVEQEFEGTIAGEVNGKNHAGDFKEEAPPAKKP